VGVRGSLYRKWMGSYMWRCSIWKVAYELVCCCLKLRWEVGSMRLGAVYKYTYDVHSCGVLGEFVLS
jgi:hypothetical protein